MNGQFPGINYQIAPVEGFGIERFVAEAKDQRSTWDVYVGQTPFVEMSAMAAAGVIEPWDDYIPKDVRDDIIESIGQENLIDGKMYGWPFLLDVIGTGWHSGFTAQANLPDEAPATWDIYLERAKAIVDSGAAPFGATFDSHGWRSLVPFTHSMSPDVYKNGLFDFTSDAAVEALVLMKKIMAYANPDILLEGATDGGVNGTPDEVAFAAQRVGYYNKYFNAPLRMAQNWDDPTQLHLGPLPKFANGAGSTVFWTTGSALFKYGQNKEQVVEYIRALTMTSRSGRTRSSAHPAAILASCRRTSRSMRSGNRRSRTGCRPSSASFAPSSTMPRPSRTTSSGSSSSSSASRSGRPTSRARSRIPRSRCRR